MTGHEDLCEVPARVLASKLRRKELSAAEALELHLARIEHRPRAQAGRRG